MKEKTKLQIIGILVAAFAIMSLISLAGHNTPDDMMIVSDEAIYGNPFSLPYINIGGMMGAYFSYIAFFFLGWGAYFGLFFLLVLSLRLIGLDVAKRCLKHAGVLWATVTLLLIIGDVGKVSEANFAETYPDGVGALGHTLIEGMIHIVGVPGAYIIGFAVLICVLVYYGYISHRFRNLVAFMRSESEKRIRQSWQLALEKSENIKSTADFKKFFKRESSEVVKERRKRKKPQIPLIAEQEEQSKVADKVVTDHLSSAQKQIEKKKKVTIPGKSETVTDQIEIEETAANDFIMPSNDLLNENKNKAIEFDTKELENTAKALRETLETFGVRLSSNIEMFPGPIITRFEIKPAAGIKVSQISNLSEDLALNLKAKSIRIVAPIPGKGAVGIEIPNRNPHIVYLRDILESDKFQENRFHLPLALGKNISGNPYVVDLTTMPHLLIAGTTGSGKSVCINVIITSLMYSLPPENLRFIFIDPKMLELTVYKDIPHLEEKVVTNAKQAERVLNDVVLGMEHRYRTLANESVRNIVDYNRKMKSRDKKLPYIVIIIDELADLMMSTHSSRVELLLTRLAQMARAVGIHLILATQRPSVDVITGLIKANFPSRVAFQVATRIDSRTILDGNGAERLLGNGDMLYLKTGSPEPERLHGPYISSDETEALVTFIKQQPYSKIKQGESEAVTEEKTQIRQLNDPVMMEAVETVIRQGQASVSLLQRKLGIGYQRAARLIDELEEMKIIGPYNESKARDVLVDKAFLENIKNGKYSKT
ncbi:MAG: DNA translocase FtsK [candidate division Zixibacteria bacterium]